MVALTKNIINLGKLGINVRSFSTTFARNAGSKFVKFDWQDPLNLESKLTEEERMIRDTAYSRKSFSQSY
mgnify:CR=1 FL=1